jgi:hypothetical protein
MRNRNAGLRAKPANPFLQVPSFTSDPSIVSRADPLRGLRACLSAMNGFCREKGDPLGVGDIIWPGDRWLSGLSADIQILASKHKRGGNTIWTCIKTIDGRYPNLKLGKNIENMVNRAAKLCQGPAAITIQKQAMAGSRAAKKCFEALKLFREGKCEISSVDWDEYREILTPAPGQNCQAKAAEMVMDWLRWNLGMNRDVAPLKYWIGRIGNLDLASRLMPRDSATAYDEMREQDEKLKSRKKAVVRQRISRLRRRISKLNDNCRALLRLIFRGVLKELRIIDSVESTDREREAAAIRLGSFLDWNVNFWQEPR